MIKTFPNKFICDKLHDIRILLYKADGRIDYPPDDLIDFKQVDVDSIIGPPYKDLNENSNIPVSPAMKLMKVYAESIDNEDVEDEIIEYKKDFLNFPFEISGKSDRTEIAYYFYYYSDMSKKDPIKQALMKSIVFKNFAMRRSDFLYMMIFRKFVKMESHYQKFLKGAREYFQFSKKTSEVIVLKRLINYYSDILKSTELQLTLFSYVLFSKQIEDLYTQVLIEFLTLRLNNLLPENDKYYVNNLTKETETTIKTDENIVYELHEGFSLTGLGIHSESLDRRQSAILFHYLRRYAATIEYSNTSYSKLIHYFSGFSAENLRQDLSYIKIENYLKEDNSNATIVINLLKKIIEEIEKVLKEKMK